MTVLQLLPALDSGGVERGTLEVAAELVRRGHRSLVISAGGRLVESLTRAGSEHFAWSIGVKTPLTLRYVSRLRQFIRENKVNIVHARSRVPAWIAHWACQGTNAKFVTTVHGLYSVNAYSAIMTRGERVIAVSETVRRYITANYPRCAPGKISVIPRGVDPAEFPYGHQPPVKPVLTLPGRLTRLKGHHDFFELLRRFPNVTGLIVGEEDPRRRQYAAELRRAAPPNAEFTGHRADMRVVLAESQIVFSLSQKPESFGRTTLEALSLGVPVIGYDHGGVGEILAELFPAGRVPLGDLDALAKHVGEFLERPPVVPRNDRFTLRAMLDAELALYEELAK